MSATFSLFERWKKARGFASDAQAAQALGLTRGTVHLWRTGRNGSAAAVERMAKELGEDPVPVILQAFAESARDAEDQRTLSRLAKRAGAACLALMMLTPMIMFAAPVQAAEGHTTYTLCAVAMMAAIAWINRFRGFDSPRHQPIQLEPLTCNHRASCLASQ